jgi:hypothetical protein
MNNTDTSAQTLLLLARLADNVATNTNRCAQDAKNHGLTSLASSLMDLSIDTKRTADRAFRLACERFEAEQIVSAIHDGCGFAAPSLLSPAPTHLTPE